MENVFLNFIPVFIDINIIVTFIDISDLDIPLTDVSLTGASVTGAPVIGVLILVDPRVQTLPQLGL